MEEVYKGVQASFPEAPIFAPVNRPIGPHPTPMFEFHIAPASAANVMRWLVENGRGLRALVHPHTGDGLADHTQLARWVGEPLRLNIGIFKKI
jgi:aromatic ring-cleaving dioxygenase